MTRYMPTHEVQLNEGAYTQLNTVIYSLSLWKLTLPNTQILKEEKYKAAHSSLNYFKLNRKPNFSTAKCSQVQTVTCHLTICLEAPNPHLNYECAQQRILTHVLVLYRILNMFGSTGLHVSTFNQPKETIWMSEHLRSVVLQTEKSREEELGDQEILSLTTN